MRKKNQRYGIQVKWYGLSGIWAILKECRKG